jgi:hypothetical protein
LENCEQEQNQNRQKNQIESDDLVQDSIIR